MHEDLKFIEEYKGHNIYDENTAIVVVNLSQPDSKYYVALDDSKLTGKKIFEERYNNVDCAKRYIDLKVPVIKTYKVYQTVGEDLFSDEVDAKRDYVGVIEATDLNDAWHKTQNDFGQYDTGWNKIGQTRSCAMGDVFEEPDGRRYQIIGMGFKLLD